MVLLQRNRAGKLALDNTKRRPFFPPISLFNLSLAPGANGDEETVMRKQAYNHYILAVQPNQTHGS